MKILLIILFVLAAMISNAQSPFKSEPRLAERSSKAFDKLTLTATTSQPDSILNVYRFAVAVSPAGFTFSGTYQASAGLEYGLQHQSYNYASQTYTVLWSANAVWIPINTGTPVKSIKDFASFGALVGIKNNLLQVGPFVNPNATGKDKFGVWFVVGVNLN